MDSDLFRLTADVYGRVQGVGFRYSTLERAQSMGLVGNVTNRWNGSVHVVAEGHRVVLESFLDWLHRGPMMAHVSCVESTWDSATNEYELFEVV